MWAIVSVSGRLWLAGEDEERELGECRDQATDAVEHLPASGQPARAAAAKVHAIFCSAIGACRQVPGVQRGSLPDVIMS